MNPAKFDRLYNPGKFQENVTKTVDFVQLKILSHQMAASKLDFLHFLVELNPLMNQIILQVQKNSFKKGFIA